MAVLQRPSLTNRDPFKGFYGRPEIIRLAVMLCVRFPLPLRNVEDVLHERGVDISYETVRYWWSRFALMIAAGIHWVVSRIFRTLGHVTTIPWF
jgi:transposase-like protein